MTRETTGDENVPSKFHAVDRLIEQSTSEAQGAKIMLERLSTESIFRDVLDFNRSTIKDGKLAVNFKTELEGSIDRHITGGIFPSVLLKPVIIVLLGEATLKSVDWFPIVEADLKEEMQYRVDSAKQTLVVLEKIVQ